MKKLLYILLVIPICLLLVSCKGKPQEQPNYTQDNVMDKKETDNEESKLGKEEVLGDYKVVLQKEDANLEEGYIIIKYTGSEKEITLPNEYNGKKILYLGSNAFKDFPDLESITLNTDLKCLKQFAFADCKNLNKIILNDNLEEIGPSVFKGCENLKEITIPQSVKKIGYNAFVDCNLTIKLNKDQNTDNFANNWNSNNKVEFSK